MDYLEANLDWLEDRLAPLLKGANRTWIQGSGFRVQGSGFRVQVQDLGFRVILHG